MKRTLPLLAVLLLTLSACQTTKAERTNDCTCAWENMNGWKTMGTSGEGALA